MLAAFSRSAYVEVAGEVAAVAAADLERGPLVILVEGFEGGHVVAGDEVALEAGRLRAGACEIALDGAPQWDPALQRAAPGAAGRLPEVERAVTRDAPRESVASLLGDRRAPVSAAHRLLLESLHGALAALGDALSGPGTSGAAAAAAIAGQGPGLTPSGDDVLVGILHAMTAWPAIAARTGGPDTRSRIAGAAIPRTTRISAAHLRAAAEGWAAEPWHALIAALNRPAEDLDAAVVRLLRVGETSGADALTGFCWAWRRLGA